MMPFEEAARQHRAQRRSVLNSQQESQSMTLRRSVRIIQQQAHQQQRRIENRDRQRRRRAAMTEDQIQQLQLQNAEQHRTAYANQSRRQTAPPTTKCRAA